MGSEMCIRDSKNTQPNGLPAMATGLMTIGLFAGWQFVCGVVLLYGLLRSLTFFNRRCRSMPELGWLALAAIMHLCFWRWAHWPVEAFEMVGGWLPLLWFAIGAALVWCLPIPSPTEAEDNTEIAVAE